MNNKTLTKKLRKMTDSERILKLNDLVSLYISKEQIEKNTILSEGTREVYLKQNRKHINYLLEELFGRDCYHWDGNAHRVIIKIKEEE